MNYEYTKSLRDPLIVITHRDLKLGGGAFLLWCTKKGVFEIAL